MEARQCKRMCIPLVASTMRYVPRVPRQYRTHQWAPGQIFFNTIPFVDRNDHQIVDLVTAGGRPKRLLSPRMGDSLWDLIGRCWSADPFERPTMKNITEELLMVAHTDLSWDAKPLEEPTMRHIFKEAEAFTPLHSLLATLKKVYTPGTLCAATNHC